MAPKLTIHDIALSERPVRFSMPFRFGAITVQGAPQLFVHVRIEVEGHGGGTGATAELMVPKWFNKDPALSPDDTVDQLRRSVAIARDLYLSQRRFDTAFGLHAACIGEQTAACARENIPALAAAFGPAEIDKAIVDALLRVLDLDVFAGLSRNVVGLDARLATDLDDGALMRFLAAGRPAPQIAVRHTVGMADSIESLQELMRASPCRYFKLKLSGDPAQDRDRLVSIAAALAALGVDYRASVDANEQYGNRSNLATLVRLLREDDALRALSQRLLYIEQPLPRELTWAEPLGEMANAFDFIIDEADDSYDAFPRARALGYRGVSSKACKGLYKSLLNGTRAARWNESGGERAFIAAEDLTCQAGLAVQQDTALAAFLGVSHVERNGHHYVDGFADTPREEAHAFLTAHPDLYEETDACVGLAVREGSLSIASLTRPGFASGVDPEQVGRSSSMLAAVGHR